MENKQQRLLVVLAFGAIYIIWGTTYLAVLFGLEGFPPFLLSAVRFTLAGLLIGAWCLAKRERMPSGSDLKIAIISGIIMLVGGSGLVTWSEQYIASGHAAVVVATEPFLFLLLDRKKRAFYLSRKGIIVGLVLGFTGILLFFLFIAPTPGSTVTSNQKFWGNLVLFGSAILWVLGSLYSQRKKDLGVTNTTTTAVQLVAAGLFSFLLSLVTGEGNSFSLQGITPRAWGGLLYLIFMGSIVAYLAFTWLLTVRSPAQVSTHTYINPVIAVAMGWWIAYEPVTGIQLVGLVVILIGVFLTNRPVSS